MNQISSKEIISIITITSNNYDGLKKTLESVKTQSSNKIEHIIIDNLSKDGTYELVKNYLNKKPNEISIKYVRESDQGIAYGMNKGINYSSGTHILFLNSGDVFFNKNTIKETYKIINLYPDKSLYLFGVLIESNNKLIKKLNLPINLITMLFSNFIHHQGAIYDLNFLKNNISIFMIQNFQI